MYVCEVGDKRIELFCVRERDGFDECLLIVIVVVELHCLGMKNSVYIESGLGENLRDSCDVIWQSLRS